MWTRRSRSRALAPAAARAPLARNAKAREPLAQSPGFDAGKRPTPTPGSSSPPAAPPAGVPQGGLGTGATPPPTPTRRRAESAECGDVFWVACAACVLAGATRTVCARPAGLEAALGAS